MHIKCLYQCLPHIRTQLLVFILCVYPNHIWKESGLCRSGGGWKSQRICLEYGTGQAWGLRGQMCKGVVSLYCSLSTWHSSLICGTGRAQWSGILTTCVLSNHGSDSANIMQVMVLFCHFVFDSPGPFHLLGCLQQFPGLWR